MRSKFIKISALAIVMATSSPVFAGSFGEFRDQLLKAHSMKLFGENYLKGKVWFTSTQDNGTLFSISLDKS